MITNKSTYVGRLTKDPEFSVSANNGTPVAKFTLAVDRTFRGPDGEKVADFFQFKAFKKTAEYIANYTAKGALIMVDCHMVNDNYEKDGKKVFRDSIIVDEVKILISNKNNGQQPQGEGNTQNQSYSQPQSQPQGQSSGGHGNYGGQPQYNGQPYNQPPQQQYYGGNQGYDGNQYQYQTNQPQYQNGPNAVDDGLPF